MAKIPVHRTVMRDGKLHVQTYWEESDPRNTSQRGSSLSKLAMMSPQGQNKNGAQSDDPVRKAWNVSTLVSREAVKRGDSEVESCIAAGFTPEAAHYLRSYVVPNGESLTDYIYDNGLDQAPRPRDGWKGDGTSSGDQRKAWLRVAEEHGITLEQAVSWIDAGFAHPFSGIPALIKGGVSPERAMEWERDIQVRYRGMSTGGNLYIFEAELKSDLTLEEALEWRKAMSSVSVADNPLGVHELKYRKLGFKPDEAARWKNVASYNLPVEKLAELRALKWSPSAINGVMKELRSGRKNLLSEPLADELIYATPLVGGPKVVKAWAKVVYQSWEEGFSEPRAVQAVNEAEAWKAHAKEVTGYLIEPKDYYQMASLLPLQRDAYLEIMNIEGRDKDTPDLMVPRAMSLAKVLASPSNINILRENGFPLGTTSMGTVNASAHAMKGYDVFNAASASPEDRNKWMRSVATTLYWRNTPENRVTGDDMRKVIDNPDIDPVKLKDTLLSREGNISPVQLEGVVVAGVESAVSDGWL